MLNYMNFTNGWTPNMEGFHLQCIQKCQGYAWMHFQAASFYNRLFLALMVPSAILSVLVGSAGLASMSTVFDSPLWWLFLAIFVINMVVGALTAVNGLLEPNLTAFQHHQLAGEFIHLVRKLQTELLTEPSKRVDCDDFKEMTNLEYENLLKNDIGVPSHIVKKFQRSVDEDTAMPEMILDKALRRPVIPPTPSSDSGGTPPETPRRAFVPETESYYSAPQMHGSDSQSRMARPPTLWMKAYCEIKRKRSLAPSVSMPEHPNVISPRGNDDQV